MAQAAQQGEAARLRQGPPAGINHRFDNRGGLANMGTNVKGGVHSPAKGRNRMQTGRAQQAPLLRGEAARRSSMARTAIAVACLALALSACGRRGPLEPPPSSMPPAAASVEEQTAPQAAPQPVPDRPFILDALL